MTEEKLIFEKPLYSLKLIRGQRGEYGWEIKITGPDLKELKKEIKTTNKWCLDLTRSVQKDIWTHKGKVKEEK